VTATSANEFTPNDVTLGVGEKVTWTNTGGIHNVRFDDASFEQPIDAILAPWTVSRTFTTAGTFRYYCERHGGPGGSGMSGIVQVTEAAAPGPSPPGTSPPGGSPPGGGPAPSLTPLKVTLRVSDATPARGSRIRFFGSVRPARDARKALIQRRTRTGKFKTVAKARLRDAGEKRSTYSLRLRVGRDATYRARVRGDEDHAAGTSRTKRVDVY
jgi:plastocyanin